jgi:hypothetical protein
MTDLAVPEWDTMNRKIHTDLRGECKDNLQRSYDEFYQGPLCVPCYVNKDHAHPKILEQLRTTAKYDRSALEKNVRKVGCPRPLKAGIIARAEDSEGCSKAEEGFLRLEDSVLMEEGEGAEGGRRRKATFGVKAKAVTKVVKKAGKAVVKVAKTAGKVVAKVAKAAGKVVAKSVSKATGLGKETKWTCPKDVPQKSNNPAKKGVEYPGGCKCFEEDPAHKGRSRVKSYCGTKSDKLGECRPYAPSELLSIDINADIFDIHKSKRLKRHLAKRLEEDGRKTIFANGLSLTLRRFCPACCPIALSDIPV